MDLLLFGAELEQGGTKHPDTEALERRPGVDPRHFLLEALRFLRREAGAAIGLGPIRDGVALGDAAIEPQLLGLVLELEFAASPANVILVANGFAHFRGTIGFQPRAHVGAESVQIAHFQAPLLARKLRGVAKFTQASTWENPPAVTAP